MLGFLGSVIRVVAGFLIACLVAGGVTVMFAVTPAELVDASAPYWEAVGGWMLYTATITAVFALPFAVLAIIWGEWLGIRSIVYYGMVGIVISILGFALIVMGESPSMPSVINFYAMGAFLVTGLAAGIFYWLFAGRFAYQTRFDDVRVDNVVVSQPVSMRPTASPARPLPPPLNPHKN